MAELELVSWDVTSVIGDHARLSWIYGARRRHHDFRFGQVGDGGSAQRVMSFRCIRKRFKSNVCLDGIARADNGSCAWYESGVSRHKILELFLIVHLVG